MLTSAGIGRLGTDVKSGKTESGMAWANVRVAFRGYKKDAPPTWIMCKAFGKRADFLSQYFKKGEGIFVSGRIETDQYKSNNGEERSDTVLMLDQIGFVEKKSDAPRQAQASAPKEQTIPDDDSIPF